MRAFLLASIVLVVGIAFSAAVAKRTSSRVSGGPRPPPPRVDAGGGTCEEQQELQPHIECISTEDGIVFAEVQCERKRCFCVDMLTGNRVNAQTFPVRDRARINCSAATQCPENSCAMVCSEGYEEDREGCPRCRCRKPPRVMACGQTVSDLVRGEGCPCGCVEVVEEATPMGRKVNQCPMCRESCDNDTTTGEFCSDESCTEGEEVLLSVGPNGVDKCVHVLAANNTCSSGRRGRPGRASPVGAVDRELLGRLEQAEIPCERGFVCTPVGAREMQCQPKSADAPCPRNESEPLECEKNGLYKALQCVRTEVNETRRAPPRKVEQCRCVLPHNGTTVAGSEVTIGMGVKKPDCDREVFAHCHVASIYAAKAGPNKNKLRQFRVEHDETFFDGSNCRSCRCIDGNAICDAPQSDNCSTVVSEAEPENCTHKSGVEIAHGEVAKIGCNNCGCKDGRLKCTGMQRCIENKCTACRGQPQEIFCGPDNQNYRSQCEAVNCGMFSTVQLTRGPCQIQDPCVTYPCEGNMSCVRRGGVVCLGRICDVDSLRECFDKETLQCPAVDNSTSVSTLEPVNITDSTVVCGTDNRTYSSQCDLLQKSSTVQIKHTGSCDDPKCMTPVCAVDGVTYSSMCEMNSQANTRVDYLGACVDQRGPPAKVCNAVVQSGRCFFSAENCRMRVQPEEGCCPICGGSVSFAIDRETLEETLFKRPRQLTLDGFVKGISSLEQLRSVEDKCYLEPTVTATRDIQIVLRAKKIQHAMECHNSTKQMADLVNKPDAAMILPQAMDFVFAAALAVTAETPTAAATTDPKGGAAACLVSMVTIAVATLASTSIIF